MEAAKKISKSHFYVQKNLKKSLLCQVVPVCSIFAQGTPRWKISKSHFFVQKNLKKSPGSQMRYICSKRSNMCHTVETAGWEPDAVHLQPKIQHASHGWGSRVGARCGIFSKLVFRSCKRFQKVWSRHSTLLATDAAQYIFWKLKDHLSKKSVDAVLFWQYGCKRSFLAGWCQTCASLAVEDGSRCGTL